MHNDTPSPPNMNSDDYDDIIFISDDEDIEILDVDSDDDQQPGQSNDGDASTSPAAASAAAVVTVPGVILKHSQAVFCGAFHPNNGRNCVTGGEDDKGYVWNYVTGDVQFECSGHNDSVIATGFNHDGTLVATGDMSGMVKVWKTENGEKVWDFELSELRWLQWHPCANVLLAGTGEGEMWMWRIPSGECKTFPSHGTSNECGKILVDGNRAVAGYENGKVSIWNLRDASVVNAATESPHQERITVVDYYKDNILVMSGSTDATAKLINSNTGRVLATFKCGDDNNDEAVESVAFNQVNPLAATATLRGSLEIWDIPTQVQRMKRHQNVGISKLLWDDALSLVYTAGLDGVVRLYDGRSGEMERSWQCHEAEVLDMEISNDKEHLLTCSEDSTCRVLRF
ncbi:angio-associated migratory cell protein-like [Centruroides sculpturatus]|uniref:angio-associated migratory cell protein-like n=1 Tax=Centruroides sculpturatus TaxID=218467 RepID=UPI000C6E603E|nr:angio-associated migratory cell protein-like [Centruroides sculpturatus]